MLGLIAVAGVMAIGSGATAVYAQGAIQKCIGTDGRVTYQDTPCAAGKTSGQVERDTRAADPDALKRAGADQERADKLAETRARIAASDANRKFSRAETAEQASPPAEPQYLYLGDLQRGVVGGRESAKPGKGTRPSGPAVNPNPHSQGTMPVPGIMQSPAPCTTVQCRKR